MTKDTFWFKHDCNARKDVKILQLTMELGLEGYGIYFMLIEVLREQVHHKLPLSSTPYLAYDFHTSEEKIKTVITRYNLFEIVDEAFFSARLIRQMDEYNTQKAKRIEAGKRGGLASADTRLNKNQALLEQPSTNAEANVEQSSSDTQAIREDKSREDKSKEEDSNSNGVPPVTKGKFVKPERGTITNYLSEGMNMDDFTAMAQADMFYDYYESNGWKVGRSKMVDWKAAARNWVRNKDKFGSGPAPKKTVAKIPQTPKNDW